MRPSISGLKMGFKAKLISPRNLFRCLCRNLNKVPFNILVLAALIGFCVFTLSAQNPPQVYWYTPAEVSAAIEAVAKSYAKKDLEKYEQYVKVISEAFTRYWSLDEAQAPISPNSVEDLQNRVDSLSVIINSQASSKVQSDSLEILLAQYKELNQTIATENQNLASTKEKIVNIEQQLSNLDVEFVQLNDLSLRISQTQDSLKLVADELLRLSEKVKSMDDFTNIDIEEINKVSDCYISSRGLIEAFEISDIAQLDNALEYLCTISYLKPLVDEAVEAMGTKFNPSRNKTLIESIRIEATKPGLTQGQKQFLTSIGSSLQNQSAAVDSFLSILASLPVDYYCVPDDQSRNSLHLDEYIIEKVQAFNNSFSTQTDEQKEVGTTYNVLYTQLNDCLNQLLQDLSPNSQMPVTEINTDEKFQKYLQSIAKKVK